MIGFIRHYKLFSAAALAIVAGLVLELSGYGTAANWVIGTVAALELLPLLWSMWNDLRSGRYGVDILAATAILTSIILGQYWAAIVVALMLTGGEALEHHAEHRARRELDSLLAQAPQKAHLLRKGKLLEVRASELRSGDRIVIKPGELVPVDAVIVDGEASFDESSLTGESLPQARQKGDGLLSGSINLDGAVTARATASAENSQYQQIVRLVKSAAASKAPFVRMADRYAVPFTLLAFGLAGTVWILSGEAIRFLQVIVVATPCPLILAAPIALISGMSRASRFGIIVRSGSALERLAGARTFAFDKTGTLTSGRLKVGGVKTFHGHTEDQVLALAAGLEQNSNHVVASAIVGAARQKGVKAAKVKRVREIAGRGLTGTVRSEPVLAGRFSLVAEHGVKIPARFKQESVRQTAVYVAAGGELAGVITLQDDVRPESADTIAQLKRMGVRDFIMVTGDNRSTAETIAGKLGISHVHAEALPSDKLHVLDEARHRPLAFVGDGVNDAPILTASDLGIALGARGVAAASESADVVIMPDDLGRVAVATSIAKRTFRIARQSILVGIGLSLLLMAAFATGKFSPLTGAIIQEGVDVIVIINALRAHAGRG